MLGEGGLKLPRVGSRPAQGGAWPPVSPSPAPPAPASSGGSFLLRDSHPCVFSPRIPPHPAPRGSPPHPPPPAAAERTAHLLRDSRQHLLHRQDQLSGSGPNPPPSALPQAGLPQPEADQQKHWVHFSGRELPSVTGRYPREWRPVCAQQAAHHHSAQSCNLHKFHSVTPPSVPPEAAVCRPESPVPGHALLPSAVVALVPEDVLSMLGRGAGRL